MCKFELNRVKENMSSEEMNGSPLVWRKPSDVMKLRRKKIKERNLNRRLGFSNDHILPANELNSNHFKITKKEDIFMNPFRNSANKRPKLISEEPLTSEREAGKDNHNVLLLQRLQDDDSKLKGLTVNSNFRLCDLIARSELKTNKFLPQLDNHEGEDEHENCLPVDWSLKTEIRLTSPNPFPWSGRMTTPEEAAGVTSFTRCLPISGESHFSLDTSPNSQLLQCAQVWMHPSLPWLHLYPRQQKAAATIAPTLPMNPQTHEAMRIDWCQSFHSLFNLLRARQCPYFYLCTNGYTVLFRAAGINSNPQVHAFITPTSRGLRSEFVKEGIKFTMPLTEQNSRDGSQELQDEDNVGSEEDEEEKTDAWLKSVGVDETVMARLSQDSNQAKKSQTEIDYQPQSLVYVEDSDTHVLFNYLINCKRCIPSWGPLGGVAPTLLSPVAFTGGTLRSLQIKHRQSQQLHVLDIIGPVLPHTVHYLHMLLSARSPSGNFHVSLSTVNDTAAFSTADEHIITEGTALPVFSEQGLSDCGLEREVLHNMCLPCKTGVLSDIRIEEGKTTWS